MPANAGALLDQIAQTLRQHPGLRAEIGAPAEPSEREKMAEARAQAISDYLRRHGLQLAGTEVVDIGTWDGKASHPISVRLSPLTIACAVDPGRTLEQWWQQRKVLVVWDD